VVAQIVEPQPLDLATLDHIFIGPTWMRVPGDEAKWLLPERTLGWQVAGWCSEYLRNDKGEAWQFTLEQLRFVLWWYAIDERGNFVHTMGVLQRLKGWGKDPLLAVMCLVELCGPSRFSHWDESGEPVAIPHPSSLVQVAAVTEEQTGNTMDMMPSLMSDHFISTYRIKSGVTLIRANGGKQKLQAVTRNYRALEGKRSTFVVLNETHHWVEGNHGHKMYETIDGNVTKMDGRYLSITNAFMPGEESVAEEQRRSYENIAAGKAEDIGFLYDSVEADPRTPLTEEGLRAALPIIRGDAVWLNIDRIIRSVQNTAINQARSRRMFLNQIVAEEDALYDPAQWKAIERSDEVLHLDDEIVLGFDGGKTDDATALVAIRVADKTAFLLHLQEKPIGPSGEGWHVNRVAVNAAVHEAFRDYNVRGFFADVALWESYIDDWAEEFGDGLEVRANGGHAVAFDMRGNQKDLTFAHERLMQAIFDEALFYDGDDTLRRHAMNARRRENNYGVSFAKESRESTRKVDAYAALMLAHEALHRLRTRTAAPKKKERTGAGYFF
jgi:hypothetical protein